MAESLEIARRLKGLNNASPCSVCSSKNFRLDLIQGIKATVCLECGHIDFFLEKQDANKDRSS